ncbi:MAG TPA: hypothetical protein VKN99_23960, partial [Polyangia bacterium]|nr:hypothetical protein [Polyangia bacterium]
VVTEYAWDTGSCDPCPTPPLEPSELSTLGGDVLRLQSNFVLTRLHTRYDRQSLSDDLIFRAAPALEGGRQWVQETHVVQGGMNNFQARYMIRHYWSGPIKCDQPHWGNWGGPPGGSEPRPAAATGLANAPRGKLALGKVVRSPVPALGIAGQKPPQRPHK